MASLMTNTTHSIRADLTGALVSALTELRTRWAAYGIYRKTRAELSMLTNRDLADLGLNRAMIEQVAREAAGFTN